VDAAICNRMRQDRQWAQGRMSQRGCGGLESKALALIVGSRARRGIDVERNQHASSDNGPVESQSAPRSRDIQDDALA